MINQRWQFLAILYIKSWLMCWWHTDVHRCHALRFTCQVWTVLLQISKQCRIHPCWYSHPVWSYVLSLWSSSTNHHPTTQPSSLSCFHPAPPLQHPSLSQGPVPLLSQSLLQLGSFPSVSELVTPSQPPLAVCCDSNVSPPPLPMMSGCPLEEVTILYLSVSLSITPTPWDAVLFCAAEKLWQNTRECKGFTGKYTTVCEMINAESQWSHSII